MDPLLDNSIAHLFVDFDADGAFGNVPDLTGTAVIELVRHTLVNRTVNFDVDVVADMVRSQIGREMDRDIFLEVRH